VPVIEVWTQRSRCRRSCHHCHQCHHWSGKVLWETHLRRQTFAGKWWHWWQWWHRRGLPGAAVSV